MNPSTPPARRWPQLSQHLANLFPLLSRELTEQAARRRTYILRVIYAVVLYGFTLWVFWSKLGSWSDQSFAFLGRGRQFFEALAWLQFCGIYLFLPAMTSGVLTIEKERDTLSLLLLTRMGPWSILIGKLFSRLVPMASFILLSLPLVAVAYSLGGVEQDDILGLAWTLGVTAFQVGALALACSAWCRTTAAAFIATYLIGAALFVGPPFLTQVGRYDPLGMIEFVRMYCETQGLSGGSNFGIEEAVLVLFGPWVCLHPGGQNQPFEVIVLRTVPMLLFAGACLIFARIVLWRRAFVQPSNFLLKAFRSLDTVFHRLNQNRFTRGIVLTHEQVAMPLYDPIRWRQTKKRSLGTTRYLIRMLLALEVPVVVVMVWPDQNNFDSAIAPVYVAAWVLWVVAALVIVIQSTGLIGAERSRQTLDVLLTTPMTSETIVREKFAGVRRLIHMLWIPFATVYVYQAWWAGMIGDHANSWVIFGLMRGVLAVAIYPGLIAWLGFHFGMRCRSQTQAVLITLSLIVGVCLIPYVVSEFLWTEGMLYLFELRWLSPAVALSASIIQNHEYNPMLVHFFLAGALLVFLWSRGLKTFAVRVNRNDGQIVDDDDIDRLTELRKKIVGSGVFRARSDEE